uniref:Acetyl-CoA carboxylase biotin carboxyl carrier protein subunit n=1 Tax=Desulfobacca acetoxidans TaxID=60893 RepID=A0A7V4GAI3_9BACT
MRRYHLTIAGKNFEVEIQAVEGGQARVVVNGRPYEVAFRSAAAAPRPSPAPPAPSPPVSRPAPPPPPSPREGAPGTGAGAVTAPMPGVILEVLVHVGDRVQVGDTVIKLEAMKMENDIKSPVAGTVAEILTTKGANVTVGDVLVMITTG